jgi:hypothetical protein
VRDLPLEVRLGLVAAAELVALRHAVDAVHAGRVEAGQRGDDVLELRAAGGGDARERDLGRLLRLERPARGLARGALAASALGAPLRVLLFRGRPVEVGVRAGVEDRAAVVEHVLELLAQPVGGLPQRLAQARRRRRRRRQPLRRHERRVLLAGPGGLRLALGGHRVGPRLHARHLLLLLGREHHGLAQQTADDVAHRAKLSECVQRDHPLSR